LGVLAVLLAGLLGTAGCALAAQPLAAPARLADVEAQLRGQPERALRALDALLPPLTGADRVEALLVRGSYQLQLEDRSATERSAQELDQLGTTQPLASAAAGLLRARAVARGGPASRADRILTEALARLPAAVPDRLRLRFVDAQAGIKQSLGKLDVAVSLYQQAVGLADRVGEPWLRSDTRGSLAYALVLAKQAQRGLEINREAVAIAQQSGDLLAQSSAMTIEGIAAGVLGLAGDELQASQAAIDLARQAGAKRQEVLATANLADYYLKRSDYATALRLALQALPLAREVKNLSGESVALTNAGLATIALGRHEEGKALVQQALMLEESAGSLTEQLDIQQELGHMLERVGLLGEAWATLSEHRRLADEVFQRQHQQAVLELQEGFDSERRQRELAALQVENGLKEATLDRHDLQQRLWAAGSTAGGLLLVLVAVLLRRMRHSNAQLLSSNEQLQVASERDPLTGLANRRCLLAAMERSATEGGGFQGAMLLIDIDHFKRINDVHGHAAGDTVLVEVARRLRAALRDEDLTVRWGGEEFLVVVRTLPQDEVEALAQRLLQAIGGEPVALGGQRLAVTASIGFAVFPIEPARLPLAWERAIDLVDTAMYLAKAHGRNRAYGVRALHEEAGASATAQPGRLESAWRDGRADLTHLPGPQAVAP
jgi:diguanylate cyclase (GGDEF)-like protein